MVMYTKRIVHVLGDDDDDDNADADDVAWKQALIEYHDATGACFITWTAEGLFVLLILLIFYQKKKREKNIHVRNESVRFLEPSRW